MDADAIATIITALAAALISYLLQKPYVRLVKMFDKNGKVDYTTYKLKNAGPATAICVILQDRHAQTIGLDVGLGQVVQSVDAINPAGEISVRIPDGREPVCVYYENLFGLLFRTQLTDAGNRFSMTGRKVWPLVDSVPDAVFSELPPHRWRRH